MKINLFLKILYYSFYFFFFKKNFFLKIRSWEKVNIEANKMRLIKNKNINKKQIDTKKIKDFNEDIYPLY